MGFRREWGINISNYGVVHRTPATAATTVSIERYPIMWGIMGYLVNQSRSASKRKPPQLRRGFSVVPRVGLEPTLPEGNWILNPARLPISPPRLFAPYLIY